MLLSNGKRVEQLIGPPPAWLELGEALEIEGVKVRPVLGDFSDRALQDMPPDYIADTTPILMSRGGAMDRSPTRPNVKQAFPGKPIKELHNITSGRVAILFNGPSLANHDLHQIKSAGIPIIGMNRTHLG